MKYRYNIGDKVRVTDLGSVYSLYWEMFKKLGFKDYEGNRSDGLNSIIDNLSWVVFNRDLHENVKIRLYGIQCIEFPDKQLLISEWGISLVTEDHNSLESIIHNINKELNE